MRFLALLLSILPFLQLAQAADPVRWRAIADDLETAETSVADGIFFNPEITLVRSSL